MAEVNAAIDYSHTQRIVLLIDLNPVLHLQNPSPYLKSILTSAKTLLSFQPLSQSLFSFKLFFSSLSPLLSSSTLLKLPNISRFYNPNSLSFDRTHETLISLEKTLCSLSNASESVELDNNRSVCSLTASSMFQLVHDYAWEMQIDDPLLGTSGVDFDSKGFVRSNLVVMFSPICRSLKDLYDYMDRNGGDISCKSDAFDNEFVRVFGHVKDAFNSRDIHFSWVDVRYNEVECNKRKKSHIEEAGNVARLFSSGIKSLGWGFCSTDSIILGSTLVAFGLIYPIIGVLPNFINGINNSEGSPNCALLSLRIADVNGEPLECNYCDVQVQNLKSSCRNAPYEVLCKPEAAGGAFSKIDVMAVRRSDEFVKMGKSLCDVIVIKEFMGEPKKKSEKSSREFFADRVLEMLMEEGTSKSDDRRKYVPLWEILLSFLYRGGYWALVSLSKPDGSSFLGILKPFTVYSAHCYIIKKNAIDLDKPYQFFRETKNVIGRPGVSASTSCGIVGGESRRKYKKCAQNYKGLTWCAFCKDAFECAKMELEEAYFSLSGNSSKKLKFLKCWIKQVIKGCQSDHCIPNMPNTQVSKICQSDPCKPNMPDTQVIQVCQSDLCKPNVAKTRLVTSSGPERLNRIQEESERPLSSCAAAEEALPQTEDTTYVSLSEAPAAFFSNLSLRIQEGLESGLDLVALAQRIVNSSIHWLSKMPEISKGSDATTERSDDNEGNGTIIAELVNVLLKDPKVLASKNHDKEPSSHACRTEPVKSSSSNKARECELQILFRMEILQSGVATEIKEKMKQRFVKQICLLLEIIQCNKEEGFFGDFNLNDYVGSIIKSRYSRSLGDMVDSIYREMDLWLFDDEDEIPISWLNSEDSSQSGREYMFREETGENDSVGNLHSSEDSFPIALGAQNAREEHTRRLVAAQEMRERALRFASYTRGMPDLQRVWAPKQPKVSRLKSESLQRRSRRKDGSRRERYDKVCETPMTGNKRSCLARSSSCIEHPEHGSSSPGSVCKALFQDDF